MSRLDEAGRAVLPAGLKRGANVRPAGEDITLGHVILPADRWLRPAGCRGCRGDGSHRNRGSQARRVAVFSNGDEIVEPGTVRREAQLFDSNRFMLLAMLRRIGCEVSDLGIRRDEREQIAACLEGGSRRTRLDLELRRRFHGRGRLRQDRAWKASGRWSSGASR